MFRITKTYLKFFQICFYLFHIFMKGIKYFYGLIFSFPFANYA